MADAFQITPPTIRAEGKDVPPEQIQAGFNSLARQTQIGLNSVATDPTGPASGDLGGMYPAPTVVAVHAIGGTLDGVAIGGTTPSTGAFTTLTASTPVAVTSGGTGGNALSAHNVLIGEGSSAIGFAAPGTAGKMLISQGAAVDPAFANNPVITGGSVDGAPIGQTTPAAGNFTTLAASTAVTVPSGGTGRATLTTHGVLLGEGTSAINQTTAGTTGQMLLGVTGADPAFGNNPTITGGTIDNAVLGGTTRAAGSFTTLNANAGGTLAGTFTGGAFTGGTIDNAVIGGTTPAAGHFTTVSATGAITPSSTNGVVGTTTNDNANAGSIGEYLTNSTAATGMTSGTAQNAATLSLTAGDWDVSGICFFAGAAGTTSTIWASGISTTSATRPTFDKESVLQLSTAQTAVGQQLMAPTVRVSIASTTSVFLTAFASFAVSTQTVTGFMRARRVR